MKKLVLLELVSAIAVFCVFGIVLYHAKDAETPIILVVLKALCAAFISNVVVTGIAILVTLVPSFKSINVSFATVIAIYTTIVLNVAIAAISIVAAIIIGVSLLLFLWGLIVVRIGRLARELEIRKRTVWSYLITILNR